MREIDSMGASCTVMLAIVLLSSFSRYDGKSFTVINDQTLGIRAENERLHVRSLLDGSQGRLWIGNNGLGVLLYDGQSVSNFTEQHGLAYSRYSKA